MVLLCLQKQDSLIQGFPSAHTICLQNQTLRSVRAQGCALGAVRGLFALQKTWALGPALFLTLTLPESRLPPSSSVKWEWQLLRVSHRTVVRLKLDDGRKLL